METPTQETSAAWVQKSSMPTVRTAHAVGAVNGKIYAVGGEQGTSRDLEEYDPATDTWTEKTEMPTYRGWLSASVIDGKIYVLIGDGEVFEVVVSRHDLGAAMRCSRLEQL